jgi:hypothetical protein
MQPHAPGQYSEYAYVIFVKAHLPTPKYSQIDMWMSKYFLSRCKCYPIFAHQKYIFWIASNQNAAFVIYSSYNHQTSQPVHANNKKNNQHALFETTTQEPQANLVEQLVRKSRWLPGALRNWIVKRIFPSAQWGYGSALWAILLWNSWGILPRRWQSLCTPSWENATQMQYSCHQIIMPELLTENFLSALQKAVGDNIENIPPYNGALDPYCLALVLVLECSLWTRQFFLWLSLLEITTTRKDCCYL